MIELQQTLNNAIMAIRARKLPMWKKLWYRLRKQPLEPQPMLSIDTARNPIVSAFVGEDTDILIVDTYYCEEEKLVAETICRSETGKVIWIPCELNKKHMQHIFQLTHGRMIRMSEATPMNILTNRILVVDVPEEVENMKR